MAKSLVIYSQQRSGTHFLATLLSSHDEVSVAGEWFNTPAPKHRNFLHHFVRHAATLETVDSWGSLFRGAWADLFHGHKMLNPGCSWLGPIMMYNQTYALPPFFVNEILSTSKVIHLVRENLLRRHISVLIWRTVGRMRRHMPEKVILRTVEVPIVTLLQDLQDSAAQVEQARAALLHLDAIEVCYERLSDNTADETRRVQEFLELPVCDLSTTLQRQNPFPLKQVITNYRDVEATLKGTPFCSMLDQSVRLSAASQ